MSDSREHAFLLIDKIRSRCDKAYQALIRPGPKADNSNWETISEEADEIYNHAHSLSQLAYKQDGGN